MDNLIIHISGVSGSGKTTLGHKIKEHFKSKIIVKDLDELFTEFVFIHYGTKIISKSILKNIDTSLYQSFLDDYILFQKKPLILVGLNRRGSFATNEYYNLHAQYNFYIDIDNMLVVKQK